MIFEGFIGPSYTSRSINVSSERVVNMFPEFVESKSARARLAYYSREGLQVLAALPQSPIRAVFYQDGRLFVVAGSQFYEVYADWTYHDYGDVGFAGSMATIAYNGTTGHQVLIVSNGKGYIFDTDDNTLAQITALAFPSQVTQGVFLDGYFIVLQTNTNRIWVSGLFDGTSWSGLDFAVRQSASDNLQAIVADHRELWLIGSLRTEVWYNSGNTFPFQPIPGAFLENGAFPWAAQKLDNTTVFIGQNYNGDCMAFRAEGYIPKRVSSHAVEWAWSQYETVNDVETHAYQEGGHTFFVVNFPTAQHTWVYDASNNLWHERDWWNSQTGLYEAARPRVHAMAWGQHVVGDRANGNLYLQSPTVYTDNNVNIRKRRRAPHICREQAWLFYPGFQLDCQVGSGLTPASTTQPKAILRWSDDGGYTWSNDYEANLGTTGQYSTRAIWNRLGRARDRVFEVEISDPIPVAMVAAYLRGGQDMVAGPIRGSG